MISMSSSFASFAPAHDPQLAVVVRARRRRKRTGEGLLHDGVDVDARTTAVEVAGATARQERETAGQKALHRRGVLPVQELKRPRLALAVRVEQGFVLVCLAEEQALQLLGVVVSGTRHHCLCRD